MGLFNKLKNALFEEDIETPVETTDEIKTAKKEEEKKQIVAPVEEKKEIKKPNVFLEEDNERELFKAENTFKFPDFDEEEFQSSYKPPVEKVEKEEYLTPKEKFDRVKPITYSYDKDPKTVRKEPKIEPKEEPTKKTFKPSPVISPVYGILDKNYKKEDIVTVGKKNEEEKPKKKIDIDVIRKKAFGTLEDDIERTFDSTEEEFYKMKTKATTLPKDKEPESIVLPKEKLEKTRELPKVDSRMEKRSERIKNVYEEQEIEDYPYPEVEEEQYQEVKPVKEERKFEEDTLENDLFDLIDSMYDNREEDE